MNEKVVSYEADLNQEDATLTEKHGTIKSQLEKTLSHYLKERKGKILSNIFCKLTWSIAPL